MHPWPLWNQEMDDACCKTLRQEALPLTVVTMVCCPMDINTYCLSWNSVKRNSLCVILMQVQQLRLWSHLSLWMTGESSHIWGYFHPFSKMHTSVIDMHCLQTTLPSCFSICGDANLLLPHLDSDRRQWNYELLGRRLNTREVAVMLKSISLDCDSKLSVFRKLSAGQTRAEVDTTTEEAGLGAKIEGSDIGDTPGKEVTTKTK